MDSTSARHTWVPYLAAVAGAILVVKVALVIGSRNEALDGPMGGISHLSGVGLGLIAVVGFGLRQDTTRRRVAAAVGFAVLWVLWIMGLGDLLTPVIEVFSKAEYVGDEVPIGIAGAVLLVLAYVGWSRDQDPAPAASPRPATATR